LFFCSPTEAGWFRAKKKILLKERRWSLGSVLSHWESEIVPMPSARVAASEWCQRRVQGCFFVPRLKRVDLEQKKKILLKERRWSFGSVLSHWESEIVPMPSARVAASEWCQRRVKGCFFVPGLKRVDLEQKMCLKKFHDGMYDLLSWIIYNKEYCRDHENIFGK